MSALGLIETIGLTAAVSAADAAVKAADVEIVGMEKVIGVTGYVSVTIHFSGDVAAVQAAVDAGRAVAEVIGEVVSAEVIPNAHSEVRKQLLSQFKLKGSTDKKEEIKEVPEKAKPAPQAAKAAEKKKSK